MHQHYILTKLWQLRHRWCQCHMIKFIFTLFPNISTKTVQTKFDASTLHSNQALAAETQKSWCQCHTIKFILHYSPIFQLRQCKPSLMRQHYILIKPWQLRHRWCQCDMIKFIFTLFPNISTKTVQTKFDASTLHSNQALAAETHGVNVT